MNKRKKKLKYLLLLLVGIAVGSVVFANVEFSFPGRNAGLNLSNKPNYANAKNNFENYPIQTLRDFNEAFVKIAESATPSVVTIFTEKTVNRRVISPFEFFGRSPFDDFLVRRRGGARMDARRCSAVSVRV